MDIVPSMLNMITDQSILYFKRPEVNIKAISQEINIFGATSQISIYKNAITDCYDFELKILRNLEMVTGSKTHMRLLVEIGNKSQQLERKKIIIMEESTTIFSLPYSIVDDHVPDGLQPDIKVIKLVLKILTPPTRGHVHVTNPFVMNGDENSMQQDMNSMQHSLRSINNNMSSPGNTLINRNLADKSRDRENRSNRNGTDETTTGSRPDWRWTGEDAELERMQKRIRLSYSDKNQADTSCAIFPEGLRNDNLTEYKKTNEEDMFVDIEEIRGEIHSQFEGLVSEPENTEDDSTKEAKGYEMEGLVSEPENTEDNSSKEAKGYDEMEGLVSEHENTEDNSTKEANMMI